MLTRSFRALAAAIIVLGSLKTGAADEELPRNGALENFSLRLEEGKIVGIFGRGGSLVFFESRAEEPTSIAASINVNGLALDAVYDKESETITLDGHNSALTLADRQALEALTRRLDPAYGGRTAKTLSGFLYRFANYISQAPVGLSLGRREVRKPASTQLEQPVNPLEERDSLDSRSGKTLEGDCQKDGEDGVTYLAGGCAWLYYNSWHDATSHCYGNYPISAGCNRGSGTWENCLGRCGGGCGSDGSGSYTTDCKDHDRCCRTHGGCTNPWDDSCGDEYWDADDDYFHASENCGGCSDATAVIVVVE